MKRMFFLLLLCSSFALFSINCGNNSGTPDAGGADGGGTADAGGGNCGKAASFKKDVYPILKNSCSCHVSGRKPSFEDEKKAHENLLNLTPNCGGKYVVAGKPDESLLIKKVNADPECGAQMPTVGPKLKAEEIDILKRWICHGAKND